MQSEKARGMIPIFSIVLMLISLCNKKMKETRLIQDPWHMEEVRGMKEEMIANQIEVVIEEDSIEVDEIHNLEIIHQEIITVVKEIITESSKTMIDKRSIMIKDNLF
jgi:nucleoside-triphosphatase THEP1